MSQSFTVWSDERLEWLFIEVKKHLGAFSRKTWNQAPTAKRGYHLSNKEVKGIYQVLFEDFKIKFSSDGFKMPKSPDALKQQVSWATTTQKSVDEYQCGIQRKNRLIAYKTGFMTMMDIMYLEHEASLPAPGA